jgi:ribosomal-protein-alanine N-acetyltransferase
MTEIIHTQRLKLVELNADELKCYLDDPDKLERQLGYQISRDILTGRVCRAIEMKIVKMKTADPARQAWYTYWLMVIPEHDFGAGLIGFKGIPDADGEVEIGYGIDPAHQNKGYTTEASRAMIEWAFRETACLSVVARDTKKTNLASNRVLAKLGMHVYKETEDALYWRIDKSPKMA